jgi:hypothetical protein
MSGVQVAAHAGRRVLDQDTAARAPAIAHACGVSSKLLYVAMNVIEPLQWSDYSVLSQTISEHLVYSLLVVGFGLALRRLPETRPRADKIGNLIVAFGIVGLYWPPMHLRGAAPSLTDTLHIMWSIVTVLLVVALLVSGATTSGRRFATYSWATLALVAFFGVLTGLDAPRLAANQPTPWMGLWERIATGAFMLWMLVLAVVVSGSGRNDQPPPVR